MARDPKERPEVAELIRRIENSRRSVEVNVAQLKRTLDVPSRVKTSVTSNPIAWFGGSLGFGLVASRLFRRKPKKAQKKSSMTGILITAILALLKPALKGILMSELQRRFKVHTFGQNATQETQLPLSKYQAPPSN